MQLPKLGTSRDELATRMQALKKADADWRGGRTFSLVYPAGEDVDAVLRDANLLYLYENALNPFRFPSLRQFEVDVVTMAAGLLHGDEQTGGAMTSGGTESILLAVKTARDRARVERGVEEPEMVVPYSAHPAFAKACSHLGVKQVQVPLTSDYRADVAAAAALINDRTALVVGSAPCYPFGVVDPIADLAALAQARGISFHTDACLGGFLLPFLERLGEKIPTFDFQVPGVSTISTDVHKYGYCTKGASVIVHRSRESLHKYQLFAYDKWPGGGYASFAMAGARPAAPIAAAWAVLNYLGEEGYLRLARSLRDTTQKLRQGIEAIPELEIWGEPVMTVFSFGSREVDIFAVGDVLDERGWCLDRQTDPNALHLMVSPEHAKIADALLGDLADAVKHHGKSKQKAARYS